MYRSALILLIVVTLSTFVFFAYQIKKPVEKTPQIIQKVQNVASTKTINQPINTPPENTSPSEEKYKQLALDYLAGKDVAHAASLKKYDEPFITTNPDSFKINEVVFEYNQQEELYFFPIEPSENTTQRNLKMVILKYSEYPYYAEVAIDPLNNNKIAYWRIGEY